MTEEYDVVVLGAGTAGLGAARTAVAAGRRVALVEADRPGGDCTWYGCVPSKTLLETACTVHRARAAAGRGVTTDVRVDFAAVMAHVRATIEEIYEDESPRTLAGQGIDLLPGRARFVARDEIEAGGRRLRGRRFVVATGATARVPDVAGLDTVPYLTSETAWGLDALPGHLLVLGGGPYGCETAQAFARLGARVTLLQGRDRLLPHDEPSAGSVLADVLRREGVDVRLGAKVVRASPSARGPVLHTADGEAVAGTHLVVATGRRARTDGLGLDAAGVGVDGEGRVAVDARLRTSASHVYAVGDCASALAFTHVADEQGRLAARNLLFADRRSRLSLPSLAMLPGRWHDEAVPWVTYTDPEVAHVGLTEAQAYAAHGGRALVATVPMAAMDRARCAGETDGFVTLVAAPGPLGAKPLLRLAGMTVVATNGGELLAAGSLAVRARLPVARLAQTITAYPTRSIAIRVAAALFFTSYGGLSARPARPAT